MQQLGGLGLPYQGGFGVRNRLDILSGVHADETASHVGVTGNWGAKDRFLEVVGGELDGAREVIGPAAVSVKLCIRPAVEGQRVIVQGLREAAESGVGLAAPMFR